MITFKDKTFCASPNCTNECGRKITESERMELNSLNEKAGSMGPIGVCYGYFCGEPEDD